MFLCGLAFGAGFIVGVVGTVLTIVMASYQIESWQYHKQRRAHGLVDP